VLSVTAASANELFVQACKAVTAGGTPASPRGLSTVEVLGAHLCLTEPRRRFVDVPPLRILNPAFAVAEALWILSGSDDAWIFEFNGRLTRYADDGVLRGAYGPRMRAWRGEVDQLDRVRRLLSRDPDSRQAVIQLFDPGKDWSGFRDVPCTLGYRFFIRGGRLHMHTTMRSQDLWLGFPYDVFTATLLQELLAGWLSVELGTYHHHVDSLHLYERDLGGLGALSVDTPEGRPMDPIGVSWCDLPELLAAVTGGELATGFGRPWDEFATVLASYRAWKRGEPTRACALAESIDGDLGAALERWYHHLSRVREGAATEAVR
jgi:thymidylate synthase